jgi:hypothetical protein
MAIAFVQAKSLADNGGGGNNHVAAAYTSNVTAGNLLVCCAYLSVPSTQTIASLTDTLSNTWVSATSPISTGGTTDTVQQIFYCIANGSGANTVTLTSSGYNVSSVFYVRLFEFSGVDTGSPQDGSGTTSSAGVSTLTISPTNNNSLVVAQAALAASQTAFTPGTGYTAGPTPINSSCFDNTEYRVDAASGSQSCTWSRTVSLFSVAVFKPAGASVSTKRLLTLGAG